MDTITLTSITTDFDIKVKSIENNVVKGTRFASSIGRVCRTESTPQEFGKIPGTVIIGNVDFAGCTTATEGKHNLLAGGLTEGNVLDDLVAIGKQLGGLTVGRIKEYTSIALVTEVGARPSVGAVEIIIREDVYEANIDDVQRSLGTECAETWLIRSLAL